MGKSHYGFWQHHVIGPVQTNTYILSPDGHQAVLFDPGGPEAVDIVKQLQHQNIEISAVLCTHGHFDHLSWASEVQDATDGAKVYLHEGEKDSWEYFHDWLGQFGYNVHLREPDVWVSDKQVLDVAGISFEVIHTPGHSPGSATFVVKDAFEAYVGDVIFKQSIGRTDLPFASPQQMEKSLQFLMDYLPKIHESMTLYPGHGEFTSIDVELRTNPFLLALKQGRSIF